MLNTVIVSVYSFDAEGNRIELEKDSTDMDGKWEVEVCAGNYEVEINTDSLSLEEGAELSSDKVVKVTIEAEQDTENVNFVITEEDKGFNFWLILIPILLIVIAAVFGAIYSNSKRENRA